MFFGEFVRVFLRGRVSGLGREGMRGRVREA